MSNDTSDILQDTASEAEGGDTPALMTKASYARHRNVTRQTVGRWAERNELVMVENKNGRPRVDVKASDEMLATLQNPLKINAQPNTSPEDGSGPESSAQVDGHKARPDSGTAETAQRTLNARAAKEMSEAAMSRLKYNKMAGTLVPRVEVDGIGPAAAAMLQQSLARRVATLSRALFACQTEREVMALLRESDHDVLSQYADALASFDRVAQGEDIKAAAA